MRRLMASGAALVLLVGACGSDSEEPAADETTTTAAGDTTTTAPSDTTADTGDEPDVADDDALYLFPPVEGAQLSIEDSGAISGTTEVTVVTVAESGDGVTVTTSEVVTGEVGEPVTIERSATTSPDGGLSLSAAGFVAQGAGFEVTATGDDVVIPPVSALAGGESSTGSTFVEFSGSGIDGRSDVTYTVTGQGTEAVTTPLGTFDVQIVVLELTISSSLAGEQSGTVRYSFLPGFGSVRTETNIAGFAITSTVVASTVAP